MICPLRELIRDSLRKHSTGMTLGVAFQFHVFLPLFLPSFFPLSSRYTSEHMEQSLASYKRKEVTFGLKMTLQE